MLCLGNLSTYGKSLTVTFVKSTTHTNELPNKLCLRQNFRSDYNLLNEITKQMIFCKNEIFKRVSGEVTEQEKVETVIGIAI